MPTITPSLWFDNSSPETGLEAAVAFYTAVFPNSTIEAINRRPDTQEPVSATFVLDGSRFLAINGGPEFPFTEAVSFLIECADQVEVDYYWDALVRGGEESQCGWLKDRFGVSWQVAPRRLFELLGDSDPARAAAATEAMFSMRKIVVADLEAAADAVAAPNGGED
jgi:predicted 3-demethylubiquinone-9 3-methyltransferase (glyoxalase superfamily)